VWLTPTQHLARASLALRGVRPSIDDLRAVAADPTKLPSLVDGYLATPEFGDTMIDLHNEALLLRTEFPLLVLPVEAPLTGSSFTDMAHAYDEPLQLIKDIVTTDQPYTQIVTANYTMANGVVAAVWGLPHTQPADVWERATWPDGRDPAGILATSIIWERWRSTGFNFNRGRANMVSRALLCHDFLDSDIAVDTSVDLSDPDKVAHAVVENASCAACHQALDPLASYFFPNYARSISSYPTSTYDATKAKLWMTTNERPPGFFGDAPVGLGKLGQAIAADPRFSQCAAIHFASFLGEVPDDQLAGDWIARLQQTFEANHYSAKQLAKAVVLSDEFRVAGDTDPARAELAIGYEKLRPEQMYRMLVDLTGFEWTTDPKGSVGRDPVGHVNLLESDYAGFRALAGGIDSYFVTSPVLTMNVTSSLTAKLGSGAAADFVIEHDAAADPSARTVMTQAAVTDTDETHVRAELAYLHARIYSELVDPNDPSVDDTYALFQAALATTGGDAKRTWKLTLVGMLSDLRSQYY
jgi:hypothetical protein